MSSILFSHLHLGLPGSLFPSGFRLKFLKHFSSPPRVLEFVCPVCEHQGKWGVENSGKSIWKICALHWIDRKLSFFGNGSSQKWLLQTVDKSDSDCTGDPWVVTWLAHYLPIARFVGNYSKFETSYTTNSCVIIQRQNFHWHHPRFISADNIQIKEMSALLCITASHL